MEDKLKSSMTNDCKNKEIFKNNTAIDNTSKIRNNQNEIRNKSNLFVASSLSLLCLVAHEALDFDSVSNPFSIRFLPRWSSLLGILTGAVLTKCSLISYLGYKSSFVVSLTGYIVSLLFHFFPSIVALTVSGFIEGVCWLVLTVSLSSYVTQLAFEYCQQKEEKISRHNATSKYLSAPYFFYKLSELAILVFDQLVQNKENHQSNHSSLINTTITSTYCNLNQLYLITPSINHTSSVLHQEHLKLNTDEYSVNNVIIGASGGACSMAIACIYHFLDDKRNVYHAENKTRSIRYNFVSSLYVFKDKTMLLMIPLIIYMGMARAYIYNKGITYNIYCQETNYVHLFTVYTAVCCLFSALYHTVGEKINSSLLILLSLFIHFSLLVVDIVTLTRPIYVQLMIAIVIGLTEVVLYCYVKGTFGTLYESKGETSFTLFEVFQKIGFYIFHVVLTAVYGNEKTIGLLVFLTISGACYFYSTKMIRRKGTLHRFDIPYFL